MDKVDIKMLFDKKQEEMLAKFNLSSLLGHPVSKGDATEAEWKNWFTSFFPDRYKAENAFVIDCKGNRSDQIDIVIYDKHFSPTIFEYNDEKYIPAESVYGVFEVKQTLSKEHIQYASNKIESVKSLLRTSAPINTINGFMKGRTAAPIIGGLLTLKSDWKTENIEKNIYEHIGEIVKNKNQNIDFICCLSSYSAAIKVKLNESVFFGEKIIMPDFEITNNGSNSPLIFTYFKLLRMLQDMGNAPAIEYGQYGIDGIDPPINSL